jgi:hypothetical protein
MMRWRTECTPSPFHTPLKWNESLFFAGSCFADHMFQKHTECLFDCFAHPTGIVFHPLPLLRALETGMQSPLPDFTLVEDQGLWHSLDHHGSFSHFDKSIVQQNISERWTKANAFLSRAQVLVLTWGTAWGYRHFESNTIVANCHKIPQRCFTKECSTSEEIVTAYAPLLSEWLAAAPARRVVITVSPVRYLKDGFEGNAYSKAMLLLAARQLAASLPGVLYFPSYEIFIDDLRDYRFVNEDLVHPNKQAVSYIWEKWKKTAFDVATQKGIEMIAPLQKRAGHRPIHAQQSGDFIHEMRSVQNAVCLEHYGQLPAHTTEY